MKKSQKTAAADYDDDSCYNSPFSCLPDEAVLEILKKSMELKTLCACELVSKRFYDIVHQVDTIWYTSTQDPFSLVMKCELFVHVLKSMKKFNRVKSLCIQFPSICPREQRGVNNDDDNNNDNSYDGVLFKWKVKMGFNRIDSFVFVSPISIYDKNNDNGLMLLYGEEKEIVELPLKSSIALDCYLDAITRFRMLFSATICLPLLEKVSSTDLGNRGRVSVNGRAEIDDFRNQILSEAATNEMFSRVSEYYLPLLELPVSGYVMKGVTLVVMDSKDVPDDLTFDSFINDEIDFNQDKEEAAYHEAMTEFFKKLRQLGVRLR